MRYMSSITNNNHHLREDSFIYYCQLSRNKVIEVLELIVANGYTFNGNKGDLKKLIKSMNIPRLNQGARTR